MALTDNVDNPNNNDNNNNEDEKTVSFWVFKHYCSYCRVSLVFGGSKNGGVQLIQTVKNPSNNCRKLNF